MFRGRTLAAAAATLAVACGLLLPVAASASLNPVVQDCYAHTALTKAYSSAALQRALNNIPPQIAEYSACSDIIRGQLDKQLGTTLRGSGPHGSGGTSFLPAWLIILIVLILGGGGAATIVARRRREEP